MDALLAQSLITSKQPPMSQTPSGADGDVAYRLTEAGHQALTRFGVRKEGLPSADGDLRYCLDWSEQRPHLAGTLGVALTERLFDLGWITRGKARRVIRLTDGGHEGLHTSFGLRME
jgi:DNA-binding PadR family transcriptional regulator